MKAAEQLLVPSFLFFSQVSQEPPYFENLLDSRFFLINIPKYLVFPKFHALGKLCIFIFRPKSFYFLILTSGSGQTVVVSLKLGNVSRH